MTASRPAIPWGFDCVLAGVSVSKHWQCPCGLKPSKKGFTALIRRSGLVVCADCAAWLWLMDTHKQPSGS